MSLDPRVVNLYSAYIDSKVTRREFLARLTVVVGSSAAVAAVMPLIEQNHAQARQVTQNDKQPNGPPVEHQRALEPRSNPMTVDPRILKLFDDLEGVWRARDFKRMRSFWGKNLPAPMYLPEEKKEFITSWEAFDNYFAATAGGSQGGVVTYKPLTAMALSPDHEMVAFELEWTTKLVGEAQAIGGSVRGFALVHDDGADWKLKAYIEAPLAPIIYMRELYGLVAKSRGM